MLICSLGRKKLESIFPGCGFRTFNHAGDSGVLGAFVFFAVLLGIVQGIGLLGVRGARTGPDKDGISSVQNENFLAFEFGLCDSLALGHFKLAGGVGNHEQFLGASDRGFIRDGSGDFTLSTK
eukprot:Lithocolla_globosa_v1_NODE_1768_length_2349_cov_6183.342633.p4 type:complete len:123 gc:universal NODE_1768_length_2349_cov_6183.342633:2348-1980(-)